MPDQYSGFSLYAPFFVKNRNNDGVAARYLTDGEGNFLMNPNKAGVPYIAPLDYDPVAVIAKNSQNWRNAFNRTGAFLSNSDDNAMAIALGAARGQVYRDLSNDFSTGGPQDLQRSYNGRIGGSFVDDFTDATALNLGLAAGAGNISGTEAAMGGGLLNIYKAVKGDKVSLGPVFGLRPGSYADVMEGIRLHNDGVFDGSSRYGIANMERLPVSSDDPEGTGYESATTHIPDAADPALGLAADQAALNNFLRPNSNCLIGYGSRNALIPDRPPY